jgi:tRNA A37 threonylcarbamoyladenosine dehydratase
MDTIGSRLELLVGDEGIKRLQSASVLILGIGGVGSWTAEALARSCVGHLTLVDYDTIKASNLNRQIHALHSTLGRSKVDAMADRIRDINPSCRVEGVSTRLEAGSVSELLSSTGWSCVIDAIDERQPKTAAIVYCLRNGIPILSSMGSANKTRHDLVQVADISETYGCPLAKLMRKALNKEGIQSGLTVCFSPELPAGSASETQPEAPGERRPLGTIAYLPAIFGLKLAAEAIDIILGRK